MVDLERKASRLFLSFWNIFMVRLPEAHVNGQSLNNGQFFNSTVL